MGREKESTIKTITPKIIGWLIGTMLTLNKIEGQKGSWFLEEYLLFLSKLSFKS